MQAGTLANAEARPPGSQRYEKPELTGEDARKELDAADRRNAELAGGEQQMRMEMEARAAAGHNRVIHEMLV